VSCQLLLQLRGRSLVVASQLSDLLSAMTVCQVAACRSQRVLLGPSASPEGHDSAAQLLNITRCRQCRGDPGQPHNTRHPTPAHLWLTQLSTRSTTAAAYWLPSWQVSCGPCAADKQAGGGPESGLHGRPAPRGAACTAPATPQGCPPALTALHGHLARAYAAPRARCEASGDTSGAHRRGRCGT
jgi:hypothetical protein